jgi:hypothetical protein
MEGGVRGGERSVVRSRVWHRTGQQSHVATGRQAQR